MNPLDKCKEKKSYPISDPIARFEKKFEKTDGCWIWRANTLQSGYGQFYNSRRKYLAHRFSYMTYIGEIPAGLVLDHLCRVRNCVNPAHLEPVTMRENICRSPIVGLFQGRGPKNKEGLCTYKTCSLPRAFYKKINKFGLKKTYFNKCCSIHVLLKNRI